LNRKEIWEPLWLGHQRSSNVKTSKQVLRLQAFYGKGIKNYMNDAPADVLIVNSFSNAQTPILGKPVPILSRAGFFDLNWSDKWTSTVGHSRVGINNSEPQTACAFKSNQYAVCNALAYPVNRVILGQSSSGVYRDHKSAWRVPDYRIQFSAEYNLSFREARNIAHRHAISPNMLRMDCG
jgi:hypothetical protein